MIKRLLLILSLCSLCALAASQSVSAFSLFKGVDCSKASGSTVCNEEKRTNNPLIGDHGLLIEITNIIAYAGGAAAVIVLIVGAIKFVTAGSDTSKGGRVDADVENAKRAIASAIVGLVVIIMAKIIITFVVKKLG